MTTEASNLINQLAELSGRSRLEIDSRINLILNEIDLREGLEKHLGEVGMPWRTSLHSLAVDPDETILSQTSTSDWTVETIEKFNTLFNTQIWPRLRK